MQRTRRIALGRLAATCPHRSQRVVASLRCVRPYIYSAALVANRPQWHAAPDEDEDFSYTLARIRRACAAHTENARHTRGMLRVAVIAKRPFHDALFHARALLRVCADNGMCSYDVTPAARKAELAAIPAAMAPPTLVCAAPLRCTAALRCAA
jgi:hypothetical protein